MIILGSSSPRRIELLKRITNDFKIIKPTFNESLISISETHYALKEALGKAESIKKYISYEDILICCDTVVILNNKIFGKPKDDKDAFEILHSLSENTHEVVTAYVIIYKDKIIKKEVTSEVTFNRLSDEKILSYILNENVKDKAGAYAIQDDDKFNLIKSIKGSKDNIIGFPVEEIQNDLELLNAF